MWLLDSKVWHFNSLMNVDIGLLLVLRCVDLSQDLATFVISWDTGFKLGQSAETSEEFI